jgi:hypothetical protein
VWERLYQVIEECQRARTGATESLQTVATDTTQCPQTVSTERKQTVATEYLQTVATPYRDDTTKILLVPSSLAVSWLERRLYFGICRALGDVLHQDGVDVQFVTAA